MLNVVKRSLLGTGFVALACLGSTAARAAGPQPLPSLPSGDGPVKGGFDVADGDPYGEAAPTPVPVPVPAKAVSVPSPVQVEGGAGPVNAQQLFEHVRRGVVAIERGGVPMAIGTVLAGDGRVLTALSGLQGVEVADVRYADGTVVHARVGRSDRASDLALLIPQSLKWTEGLSASDAEPVGLDLRAMLPLAQAAASGPRLGPAMAAVKGQVDGHARDGAALMHLLDIDVKGPPIAGAPLLDSTGGVVGVLVRACKGPPAPPPSPEDEGAGNWYPAPNPAKPVACRLVVVGAPVSSIRSFLGHAAPASAAPWLGIRGEGEASGNVHGVRVVAVAPSSPAEKAALKPSTDIIVAVDGHPIDAPERLSELIAKHAPGDTVKLLVFGGEQFREVSITLRKAP